MNPPSNEYACWQNFFEDLSVSPQDVYAKLEQGLKDRQVPKVRTRRKEFLERGMLSAKRVYLQVKRDWLTYHICVAPFGTGFFVSSRLIIKFSATWLLLFVDTLLFLSLFYIQWRVVFTNASTLDEALTIGTYISLALLPVYLVTVVLWILGRRMTYHRLDTTFAFQEAVHRLLIENINQVIQASGRKPLSEEESKPVLHKLLQRKRT